MMENAISQNIPQFYVLIVLYNEYVDNTLMRPLFLNKSSVRVFFVDNSTIEDVRISNMRFSSQNDCKYIDMKGNSGLSVAYNTVISQIIKEVYDQNNKWIVIFDQDTKIPFHFMDMLLNELKKNNFKDNVYVPLVFDTIGVLSPCRFSGFRFKRFKHINLNESTSFINSGMCIPLPFFKTCKYDENIFLDFVDHDFVKTIRKLYGNVFTLVNSISLEQNFSGSSLASKDKVLHRYKIYCNDANTFYKKWSCFYFGSMCFVFLRALKLAIIYKDAVFISAFFKKKKR